jgi:hypothetical protein
MAYKVDPWFFEMKKEVLLEHSVVSESPRWPDEYGSATMFSFGRNLVSIKLWFRLSHRAPTRCPQELPQVQTYILQFSDEVFFILSLAVDIKLSALDF